MTELLVFVYTFKDEAGESTYAVAAIPYKETVRVLLGGGSTWIHDFTPGGLDTYLVEGDIQVCGKEDALRCAVVLREKLLKEGSIASDPRIPSPKPMLKLRDRK